VQLSPAIRLAFAVLRFAGTIAPRPTGITTRAVDRIVRTISTAPFTARLRW